MNERHIPHELRKFSAMSFAIAKRTAELMEQKGMNVQQLARSVNEPAHVVAVWLSGEHDFRLSEIALLSVVLGEHIVEI